MRDDLLQYYERELTFLRRMGVDFARRYPKVAGRLQLEETKCEDPHVERLLEGFAFLAARVHLKLDADFPEISAAMLDVIAPQSDLIKTLNDNERTGAELYFAEIDNRDLEGYAVDGKKVYTLVEFDDETYPNLATTGDPEMLAISAVLATPRDYAQAHPQAVSALSMLLLTGAKDLEREAYGEAKPFQE